ncbi:MAG: imidazole glycerol phosphate synthase subunit HisF [Clostridia bacterium]|nr:imidazole glycerol phosphate synthase subunit HisF [Clostridia bacterium]
MLAKRIIPCLDIKDGRVVKGTNFVNLVDAGDPVEAAKAYNKLGADELVLLDITATNDKRDTMVDLVEAVAKNIFIPFTVGGGIKTVGEINKILRAGADKISINSPAVTNPDFINEASKVFGSQCVVVAIDVKKKDSDNWEVYINGGRINTYLDAVKWAKEVEERGAGEILLTSMDRDGVKNGYDLEITKKIADSVSIPVIASGGAGKLEDFYDAFTYANASAALAASLFHFNIIEIQKLKEYLKQRGISVRL